MNRVDKTQELSSCQSAMMFAGELPFEMRTVALCADAWHDAALMQPNSPANASFSIEHTAVSRDLASLCRALDEIALSAFHAVSDTVHLCYRATPAAVAGYGHTAIQASILRVASHEMRDIRAMNVDFVHHHILGDPLVVMRTASDGAVWVLLGSEYSDVLGLPWPSAARR